MLTCEISLKRRIQSRRNAIKNRAQHGFKTEAFANEQIFDFESLRGRLLSSSYAPLPGHPNYESALAALRRIFDEFQESGTVRFDYQTMVYFA